MIEIVGWQDHFAPPPSSLSEKRRAGDRPLSWVRLNVVWHRDVAVLDLPAEERAVWPALLALAGTNVPHGRVAMDARQLARELDLPRESVEHALEHLCAAGRIRRDVADATQPPDDRLTAATESGGHVPTNVRTYPPGVSFAQDDERPKRAATSERVLAALPPAQAQRLVEYEQRVGIR